MAAVSLNSTSPLPPSLPHQRSHSHGHHSSHSHHSHSQLSHSHSHSMASVLAPASTSSVHGSMGTMTSAQQASTVPQLHLARDVSRFLVVSCFLAWSTYGFVSAAMPALSGGGAASHSHTSSRVLLSTFDTTADSTGAYSFAGAAAASAWHVLVSAFVLLAMFVGFVMQDMYTMTTTTPTVAKGPAPYFVLRAAFIAYQVCAHTYTSTQ